MSFVTTVTCARYIKDDYPPFLYIRGDFASEHVARVSDNGDRMRSSIKTEINALAKAKPLGRCLASGVPAMDCGWENLFADDADSGSLCNSLVAGSSRGRQSGHSDFQIGLQFRTKRYFSDGLSRVRSGPFLQAACDFQQGGSTHICPIVLLPKITKCDILSIC
jgi:hypothetical protein